MKMITKLVVGDRGFFLVKHMDHYCAIDEKYVDADGRINTPLNGLMMMADRDLDKCITKVRRQVAIDELIAKGMPELDAVMKVFGVLA